MQGQRDLQTVSRLIMSRAHAARSAPTTAPSSWPRHDGHDGSDDRRASLRLIASYGYKKRKGVANRFRLGEGLVGQAALEKKPILVTARRATT